MGDFQNFQQLNSGTPQYFSYVSQNHPGVNTVWMDGSPVSYISTGYRPNQIIYPQNVLQNSTAFPSQVNVNNLQYTIPQSIIPHNTLWSPGSLLVQSTPNLVNSAPLTSPMVTNPLFVPQNVFTLREQQMASTLSMTGQLPPTLYTISQDLSPASVHQVNDNYQQQQKQIWLQDQEQANHQQEQQPQKHQENLEGQQKQNNPVSNQRPVHLPINDNATWQQTEDSDENLTKTDIQTSVQSPSKEEKLAPVKVSSVKAAPPSTFLQSPVHPRQNTLPASFPKSLNSSLQIKNTASSADTSSPLISQQKTVKSHFLSTSDDIAPEALRGKQFIGQGHYDISGNEPSLSSLPTSEPSPTSPRSRPIDSQCSDHNVIKPIYEKPKSKDFCLRCQKRVYPMDKLGPIKEVLYHKMCFTCVKCGTVLDLKNFHHNPNDSKDLSVFCGSHKPKEKARSIDATAVQIKSALAAPRLDKVNDQIRSDRYPSEVLARSGCSLPATSAFKSSREEFYYGMEAIKRRESEVSHQLQQYQQQILLQQQQQHEQDPQMQQSNQQQQHLQKQYQQLLNENYLLQQQMIENEKMLTDGIAYISVAEYEKQNVDPANFAVSASSYDISVVNNVSPPNQEEILQVTANRNHDRKSPTSSLSSVSSSMMNQGSVSEDSVADDLMTPLKLDNQAALQNQKQDFFSIQEAQPLDKSEQSFMRSSFSVSPIQVQNRAQSSDDSGSRRSSLNSNISSKDSIDFGASASSFSVLRQQTPYPNERADRPSSLQSRISSGSWSEKDFTERRIEQSQNNIYSELPIEDTSSARFLPKNERVRMDRPSQFS